MLNFKSLEYESQLRNDFTPDVKIAVFEWILPNKPKILSNFAEKPQINEEKCKNTEILNQNQVNYEIRDITPKSIFRRK